MRVVVSDTSPLRALAHLGRLDLVSSFLGEVIVPPAVAGELLRPKAAFPPVDISVIPGIRIAAPSDQAGVAELQVIEKIDAGEAEAIVLALQLTADLILVDERRAEAVARRAGLATLGVLGFFFAPSPPAWSGRYGL